MEEYNAVVENENVNVNEKVPKELRPLKIYLLQYGIGILIATGLFFLTLYVKDYWVEVAEASPAMIKENNYKKLVDIADAFTFPGILYICTGLLVFISNQNVFKGVKFGLIKVAAFLLPFSQKLQDKKYSDIQDAKKVSYYGFFFVIGGILVIVAAIFIVVNKLY